MLKAETLDPVPLPGVEMELEQGEMVDWFLHWLHFSSSLLHTRSGVN